MTHSAWHLARALVALAVFWLASGAHAQTAPTAAAATQADLLREINRDIWVPFSAAYQALDVEAFLPIHRADFVRAQGDSKRVQNLAEYARDTRSFFERTRERGSRMGIRFRFTERLARGELASERGIFEFTMTPKDGAPRAFYGKFHVISRKEGGTWRFLVDYDSNEGGTITVKDFDAAVAVDDLSKS